MKRLIVSTFCFLSLHYTDACTQTPAHQNCSFCPAQQAAWVEKDALSYVGGETGVERMGPWPPDLTA